MFKKINDLEFGLNKEKQLLPVLKTFFNDDSIYHLEQSNTFDYKGNNKFIELKSRNNELDKYPTTMVGYNKICKASTILDDVYFCFCFTNGLYYYKYNKEDKFEIRKGGRYDRITSGEIQDYYYIPVNLLQKII